MVSSSTTNNDDGDDDNGRPSFQKVHSVTVCMVPPPEYQYVWEVLSDMRQKLKDPGLYRWPPHVNLLYPFLDLRPVDNSDDDINRDKIQQIVLQLQTATTQCAPFAVTLNRFGTFGGKKRGVLWLNPNSSPLSDDKDDNNNDDYYDDVGTGCFDPLISLQQKLEEAFPMCKDQSQKGNKNYFVPHLTLSHFENLEDALEAKETLALSTNKPLKFVMDRIYLLQRIGDGGQFLRVAHVALGDPSSSLVQTEIFDKPSPFPGMPTEEEDWVHEERMQLKARRNRRGRRSRHHRKPDSPEVIAAKRAERKAKRELLERKRQEGAFGSEESSS